MDIDIKRVYEKAGVTDGCRVLVDRLCARPEQGQSPYRLLGKGNSSFDRAAEKFAHDTDRWEDFKKNYHQELRNNVSGWNDFLQNISHCAKLTLLYGAHDTEHNNAAVLREYLKKKI